MFVSVVVNLLILRPKPHNTPNLPALMNTFSLRAIKLLRNSNARKRSPETRQKGQPWNLYRLRARKFSRQHLRQTICSTWMICWLSSKLLLFLHWSTRNFPVRNAPKKIQPLVVLCPPWNRQIVQREPGRR